MIPASFIQEWRHHAPWPDSRQVEQDLIITRALCDLFNHPLLKDKIAFRGGTAINKLLFKSPQRYSEDIDLVQTTSEPIGNTVDAVRDALSWLGKCQRNQAGHSIHLVFRFSPETEPGTSLKVKVEINTREHNSLYGVKLYPFELQSSWHQAKTQITSYAPEELFGTKLRALLQRQKNRDLFDLHVGMTELKLDARKVVAALEHYLSLDGMRITRAHAEQRMLNKLTASLVEDIAPLLPSNVTYTDDDALCAFEKVWTELIGGLQGESWKLSASTIADFRKLRYPTLLLSIG